MISTQTSYIHGFSALTPEGLYSPKGLVPWAPDQHDALDITRNQVIDKPYLNFGKLEAPDKLAFAATALLLKDNTAFFSEETGICIGLPFGSYSTDKHYSDSIIDGFPSPAIFSATLPSSVIAEIAIAYKIKGPNRVIAGNGSSGIQAFLCACNLLALGKAPQVLVILIFAASSDTHVNREHATSFVPNAAYSLLLSHQQTSSTNLSVTLECTPRASTSNEANWDNLVFDEIIRKLYNKTEGTIHFSTDEYTGNFTLKRT